MSRPPPAPSASPMETFRWTRRSMDSRSPARQTGRPYMSRLRASSQASPVSPKGRTTTSRTPSVRSGTSVGTSEIYVGRAISATEILIVRSRSHQYNGTASGGSTTYNVPAHTRFIVIQSSGGSATVSYVGEMTLSKVGRTSGSIGSSSCCSLSTYSISASWNTTTNVLTMTDSGHSSVNNTIYYYR
jgi:hypothetical protein